MGEADQRESEAHQRYWCWEQAREQVGEHAGGQASDQVIAQATQVQRLVKVM